MKKVGFLLFSMLLFVIPALGQQTSNSSSFTAVTPPSPPVITSLSGLSPSGKIYTGTKMPIVGTGFTSSCNVNVDGAVQPGATFVFVSGTEIDYTIPAALGSAAGTAHSITVTCPVTILSMNSPLVLPNATVGVSYNQNLGTLAAVSGGIPPYKYSIAGQLPTGLSLSQSGILSGTPSGTGSFSGTLTVLDSSGLALRIKKFNMQTLPVGAVEVASGK